jgi:hypothetical protein
MFLCTGPNATIAVSASLSGAIDIGDGGLVGIQMPTTWTTATTLSFQASSDLNGTYVEAVDNTGTAITCTGVTGAIYIALNAATFAGMRYIKIRSGTSGSPVTQAGARTITTMVRSLG